MLGWDHFGERRRDLNTFFIKKTQTSRFQSVTRKLLWFSLRGWRVQPPFLLNCFFANRKVKLRLFSLYINKDNLMCRSFVRSRPFRAQAGPENASAAATRFRKRHAPLWSLFIVPTNHFVSYLLNSFFGSTLYFLLYYENVTRKRKKNTPRAAKNILFWLVDTAPLIQKHRVYEKEVSMNCRISYFILLRPNSTPLL